MSEKANPSLTEYRKRRAEILDSRPGDVAKLYQEYEKNPKEFLKLIKIHRQAREEIIKRRAKQN